MAIQIDLKLSGHGHAQSPDEQGQGPIIGIDLGTTNSLVAIVQDGVPTILAGREGGRLLPSVVSEEDGQLVIGAKARDRKIRDPRHTVFSVKRLLGRGFEDLAQIQKDLPYEIVAEPGEGSLRIKVGDRLFTPIEISALFLKELRLSAEAALGVPVRRAVLTVPAYFNDSQRQATRTAGRLAGLDILRIVNEPTAAALAYGLDRKKEGIIAVFDLGGGTFDLSILRLHGGIFEVLSTNGDTRLGGDDFDLAMARHFAREVETRLGFDPMSEVETRAEMIEKSERLKICLSNQESAVIHFDFPGRGSFEREVTRPEFGAMIAPALERVRAPCLQALQDASLRTTDLTDVIMVGGPTRLREVQEVARSIFGSQPNTSMHPDEVVACGAAIQADILAGNNRELLLLDVVPLSLGIETYGGILSTLVPRNSRIPAVAREIFTTFVDNQTGVDIHVLQGERERAEDNRSLARFKLKGLEPKPAGFHRVEVSFLVDADGILNVSARDLQSGLEQSVEVRPSFGLTDEQVETMLSASLQHAEEDVHFRQLVDARNEAEPVLRQTEKALPKGRGLLDAKEFDQVEQCVRGLRTALQGSDPEAIRAAKKKLDESTVHMAELLLRDAMNRNG